MGSGGQQEAAAGPAPTGDGQRIRADGSLGEGSEERRLDGASPQLQTCPSSYTLPGLEDGVWSVRSIPGSDVSRRRRGWTPILLPEAAQGNTAQRNKEVNPQVITYESV